MGGVVVRPKGVEARALQNGGAKVARGVDKEKVRARHAPVLSTPHVLKPPPCQCFALLCHGRGKSA